MPSIQLPTPIFKSLFDNQAKAVVGHLTTNTRCVEMEVLSDADAPLAVSWTDDEFEHFIRREHATGMFWRRISDPLDNLNLTISRMWREDLFDFRDLCLELGGIHSDLNDEQPVDPTPRWRLPKPSKRDKKLQDNDPSLSLQNEVIDLHMANHRIIAGEIYEAVPEPVAIVRRSNPTPVAEIIDVEFTFEDTVMVYSLRDWDRAQDLIDRLGIKEVHNPVEFELDMLDRTSFGPPDVKYQQAAFLREFADNYDQHLLAEKRGAAGTLASFDDKDKAWLRMCATSLQGLDDGFLDPEYVGPSVRAFLSGEIGSGLTSLIASWRQFDVVTDALREQLKSAEQA
ncbi:hypothetical protein IHQ71_29800 (plasmid) [Rhizobium sp. TH2]|uniref:hypothetical protein n=1 Tax=Rhizobium sp. TH2 TaxID=2775403 RepID=UPI0021584C53|nr:hypothetical protein [Rhizobium sp. TH2]UVC12228.1 hypothetical protein IHQ71_29800 [Rhizobium sp. TH2]